MTSVAVTDLQRVAFLDPAGTRTKLKGQSSRQALACIGMDSLSRVFLLSFWAGRLSVDKLIQKMIEMHQQWKPRVFGIEANALQILFSDSARMITEMKGVRLPIVPVYQPTRIDKPARIRMALQPVVGLGRLFLPKNASEAIKEITSFPQGKTNDIIDAIASAVNLLPARTSKRQKGEMVSGLKAYLQEQGVDSRIINSRIAEVAHGLGLEQWDSAA